MRAQHAGDATPHCHTEVIDTVRQRIRLGDAVSLLRAGNHREARFAVLMSLSPTAYSTPLRRR